MQWHQTGLSELGSSNRKNAFGPIHIPRSEVERLAQSQTCDGEQSKQAVIGPRPQKVAGRPSFSSIQQLLDFLFGIEVRPSAVRPVWQQAQRRNFRCRISGAPVLGEATHGRQPRGPLAGLVMGGQGCPLQREFRGYM